MTAEQIAIQKAIDAVGDGTVDWMLREGWRIDSIFEGTVGFHKLTTNHEFFIHDKNGTCPTMSIAGIAQGVSFGSVQEAVKEANALARTKVFGGWE